MDLIDKAQHSEQLHLEQSLFAQRMSAQRFERPTPAGYCLNRDCVEPFDDSEKNRLYCGPSCAERHHKQTLTRR